MLDALRFASRVASQLAHIGWARARGRSDGVPRTIDAVDARWLGGALASRDPGTRVAGIRRLDGSSGTTERRRISVQYASKGRPDGSPSSLFVKFRPPGLAEQLFGNLFALGPTEVGFYRDVRARLPIRAPACYYARTGAGGDFVLLLEDLVAAGAAFPTIADSVSLTQAEMVVHTLARLHSAFWGEQLGRHLSWLRTPSRASNAAVERFVCERAHRPTLRRFADLLPESVRRGAALIHTERRALERYWADAPLTLIHGDSHVGNMYLLGDEAGLLDWQVTQHHQGIRDVAYFLVLSLDTELRRAHERDLVRLYARYLRDGGVPVEDLDPHWMWERYRSFALYTYMGTSVTATMSDLQPEHIARLGLQRAATAVDDLESLKLLASVSRGRR